MSVNLEMTWQLVSPDKKCPVNWPSVQARLGNTQTVEDLLKLTETLQHEKSRLQSREQRDAADVLKLQQALAELRAAHSMIKVGLDHLDSCPQHSQVGHDRPGSCSLRVQASFDHLRASLCTYGCC